MIQLREFIKTVLLDITSGINDANHSSTTPTHNPVRFYILSGKNYVDFDIAVTASNESSSSADAKIGISVLGAAGEIQAKTGNETASRIKFQVMISSLKNKPMHAVNE